jgi:hypothetical protein
MLIWKKKCSSAWPEFMRERVAFVKTMENRFAVEEMV